MSDKPFDMPDASHSFEERGGWLVRRLGAEFGLAPHQAAGIVGNLGYESGGLKVMQEVRPVVPGSRGGWGWAQWTGPRRRAFEAWADIQGLDYASDAANYGFLMVELRGAYRRVVEKLRSRETVDTAVFVFGHDFEAPGGTTETHLPGYTRRVHYAQRALAGVASPEPQPDRIDTTFRGIQTALVTGGWYERNVPAQVDGRWGPQSKAAMAALLDADARRRG